MAKPKAPPENDFLTIDDVASLLFVDERTIRNWINAKGMPSIKDERGRRFAWFDVLPWYVKMRAEEDGNRRKRSVAPEPDEDSDARETILQAQLRLTIAEADIKELTRAERQGQVVAVADAARTLQDVAKAIQIEILAWPTLIVGRIFGMRDRQQLFAVLTSSARELCTRLADIAVDPEASGGPEGA